MRKLIKVCGMTDAGNIRAVEALGVDLMGFIFYPKSPRRCRELPAYLPSSAARTGVFVDADLATISEKCCEFGLDWVQLHGHETPGFCREVAALGVKVSKALGVGCAADVEAARAYQDCCDMMLFDTHTPGYGGSGEAFDWSVLDGYDGHLPFLLSGGLSAANAAQAAAFRHPRLAGYDLNSRFESAPGIKDIELIETFIQTVYEQD